MSKLNRRNALWTFGSFIAAFVAYPFTSRSVLADREGERRHPRIHAAIVALNDARKDLERAAHDFGGHKKKALERIDLAKDELEICRDFRG